MTEEATKQLQANMRLALALVTGTARSLEALDMELVALLEDQLHQDPDWLDTTEGELFQHAVANRLDMADYFHGAGEFLKDYRQKLKQPRLKLRVV